MGARLIQLKIQLYVCLGVVVFVLIALLFIFIDNSMDSRRIYNLFKENNSTTRYTQRTRVSRQEIQDIRDAAKAEVVANEARIGASAVEEGFTLNPEGEVILSNGMNVGKPHPNTGFTMPHSKEDVSKHGIVITSPINTDRGEKDGGHKGWDIAPSSDKLNTPIRAVAAGKVVFAGAGSRSNHGTTGYGNCMLIDHGNGIYLNYAHCSQLLVKTGDTVVRGQEIAKTGTTGASTGVHLHIERRTGSPEFSSVDRTTSFIDTSMLSNGKKPLYPSGR